MNPPMEATVLTAPPVNGTVPDKPRPVPAGADAGAALLEEKELVAVG